LGLNQKVIASVLEDIKTAIPTWQSLIAISFLPPGMKVEY